MKNLSMIENYLSPIKEFSIDAFTLFVGTLGAWLGITMILLFGSYLLRFIFIGSVNSTDDKELVISMNNMPYDMSAVASLVIVFMFHISVILNNHDIFNTPIPAYFSTMQIITNLVVYYFLLRNKIKREYDNYQICLRKI